MIAMTLMIGIVAVSVALVAMGHYRHRTLSFRDDISESNRQFHRARLEEIPDLVSSGLIHSDQLTAIESESKHDLLSDMRGSEDSASLAIDIGWSPSRWSTCCAFGWRGCSGSLRRLWAPWVASKRWYGRRH